MESKKVRQVKQILKNMEHYANIGCGATFKEMLFLQNHNYIFTENGFILEFDINFIKKEVIIIQDSENNNNFKKLSFDDFIKFQSEFLDKEFFTSLFFEKIDGALKIKFYKKDKKEYCAVAIETDKLYDDSTDLNLSMLCECFNFKYGIFNICNCGDNSTWNDCFKNDEINTSVDFVMIDLQLFK